MRWIFSLAAGSPQHTRDTRARVKSSSLCGVDRAVLLTARLGSLHGSGDTRARAVLLAKLINERAEMQ